MLSLGRRRKTVELASYVRRIVDVTTPNLSTQADVYRQGNRYNRTFPVLVAGWSDKCEVSLPITFGLTKDFSDNGMSIIVTESLEANNVVLGVWASEKQSEQPWFFVGSCQRRQLIGGGFCLCGIELVEFIGNVYTKQIQKLLPLAQALLPADDELPNQTSRESINRTY